MHSPTSGADAIGNRQGLNGKADSASRALIPANGVGMASLPDLRPKAGDLELSRSIYFFISPISN